jgi:hypothetical protein
MEAGAAAARGALPQLRKRLAALRGEPFEPGRQGEFLFVEALR